MVTKGCHKCVRKPDVIPWFSEDELLAVHEKMRSWQIYVLNKRLNGLCLRLWAYLPDKSILAETQIRPGTYREGFSSKFKNIVCQFLILAFLIENNNLCKMQIGNLSGEAQRFICDDLNKRPLQNEPALFRERASLMGFIIMHVYEYFSELYCGSHN